MRRVGGRTSRRRFGADIPAGPCRVGLGGLEHRASGQWIVVGMRQHASRRAGYLWIGEGGQQALDEVLRLGQSVLGEEYEQLPARIRRQPVARRPMTEFVALVDRTATRSPAFTENDGTSARLPFTVK